MKWVVFLKPNLRSVWILADNGFLRSVEGAIKKQTHFGFLSIASYSSIGRQVIGIVLVIV